MKKAIIVVYGKDNVGIIYKVCKIMYDNQISVKDIKQTIIEDNFNMMMLIDVANVKDKQKVKDELDKVAEELNLHINFQLEEAFAAMHRI